MNEKRNKHVSLLTDNGPLLLKKGYKICPLAPGEKYPKGLKDWRHCGQTIEDIVRWDEAGFTGVGVQCGNGIGAIDVDIYVKKHVDIFVSALEKILPGLKLIRVGKAPKILIPFRTTEIIKKMSTPFYTGAHGIKNQVEILGEGQQFCAYHIHPETGKPYNWSLLSLTDIEKSDLPLVSIDKAIEIVELANRLMLKWGLRPVKEVTPISKLPETRVDQALDNMIMPLELTLEEIETAVQALPMYILDAYDTWVDVGMCIYHETRGDPSGLGIWEAASIRSDKYNEGDCSKRWASFFTEPQDKQQGFKRILKWGKEIVIPKGEMVMRFSDFMHVETKNSPMFINPCFGPGTLTMIYGAPGVGKSYLALTLLYAIHTGTPWLGWEVDLFTEPRSIFIDGEMPTALLKTRIIDVFGNSDLPHEARIFSKQHYLDENPDGVFNIANEGSRNYILNKVIEHDINIVFIDNKASLVNGISENDVAENEPVNSWLIRLRSMNVMVVLLHHSNKTGAQRGTSAYEDPMDNILKLGKKSDGVKRQLVWEKDRRGRPDNCDYTINLELSEFGMQPVTFTPTDVVAKSYDKINIIIGDVDKFNKDSLQKRADRLGLSKKIVFNILDKAVEDGYIEKDKTGNIIYYTLTRSGKRYLKDFKFDDSILE